MKVITMYLPQFHRVKENDEWWGEGFTEWTAVQKAEVYFDGQVQPRVPLNNNYYDLLDKRTMQWQADLMHEYNIYGFAFYHYWFKNGRKILEKPAENLLRWKDIDMPFCFSWANETWARSWSNVSNKNAWSTKIDDDLQINDSDDGILLEQEYGGENEWRAHFEYLNQFFKDERYIKKDGKPLLIIYKPSSIPVLVKMIAYWRSLAKKEPYKDLFILGVNDNFSGCLDGVLQQEPQNSRRVLTKKEAVVDSDQFWQILLNNDWSNEDDVYYCGFPGYDDTPRRGDAGTAFSVISPESFEDYMTKLIRKGNSRGNGFTFINAWNEWGEGMYLEPDELHGYKMLQAVKNAQINAGGDENINRENNKAETASFMDYKKAADRSTSYWKVFDLWMEVLEQGDKIEEFFVKHGYKNIAIYGLGMMGRHLMKQLRETSVVIDYGIDRRGNDAKQLFPIYKPTEDLPAADVIIVAVTYDLNEIYSALKERTDADIVFLSEILNELLEKEPKQRL